MTRMVQTSPTGRRFGRVVGGIAAAAALLVLVPAGQAQKNAPVGTTESSCGMPPSPYYCIDTGTTTLTLGSSWLRRVRASGARVAAIAPAVLRGDRITFPISKTGPLTPFRRSRVPADDALLGNGCTRGLVFGERTVVHHRGGFALVRRGARLTLDVPVISNQSFGLRARDPGIPGLGKLSKRGGAALTGEVLSGNDRRVRVVSDTRFAVEGLSLRFRASASALADLVPSGEVGPLSLDLRVAPRPACAG
jgi:hypothetical protein